MFVACDVRTYHSFLTYPYDDVLWLCVLLLLLFITPYDYFVVIIERETAQETHIRRIYE